MEEEISDANTNKYDTPPPLRQPPRQSPTSPSPQPSKQKGKTKEKAKAKPTYDADDEDEDKDEGCLGNRLRFTASIQGTSKEIFTFVRIITNQCIKPWISMSL